MQDTDSLQSLAALALSWLVYFFIHSLLASNTVKRYFTTRQSRWQHNYRLFYNIFAVLLLLPIAYLMHRYPGAEVWHWESWAKWLADTMAVAAIGGFIWTLKYYDGQDFLGLRQSKSKGTHSEGAFCLSPAHRFVRHPWYFLALVIIWTRDINTSQLLSYTLITAYFVVGSRLEERKLVSMYGAVYQRYQQQVPGLIPRPWRFMTALDVNKLMTETAVTHSTDTRS